MIHRLLGGSARRRILSGAAVDDIDPHHSTGTQVISVTICRRVPHNIACNYAKRLSLVGRVKTLLPRQLSPPRVSLGVVSRSLYAPFFSENSEGTRQNIYLTEGTRPSKTLLLKALDIIPDTLGHIANSFFNVVILGYREFVLSISFISDASVRASKAPDDNIV